VGEDRCINTGEIVLRRAVSNVRQVFAVQAIGGSLSVKKSVVINMMGGADWQGRLRMSISVEAAAQVLREAMREEVKRHSLWYQTVRRIPTQARS
jgi:hypothetical protein